MQYVHIDNLTGEETLSVPVVTSSDAILISEGTKLTSEYIQKLMDFNIQYVYIEAFKNQEQKIYSAYETYEESKKELRKALDKDIYKHNAELQKVTEQADKIINKITDEPDIINGLTEIRNISTDMYSHCINVCSLSTIMALRLRMTDEQVHNIAMGAILHDIGLKYITAPYIDIDIEEMSPQDRTEYCKHTVYGFNAIQNQSWLSDTAKEIILLHHENVDGSGYPFKYPDHRLSVEVKLVAVCDDFDAMISGIGRHKMKIYEAIEYIKVHSGIIYDRSAADKLLRTIAIYPVGVQVVLSNGDHGIVVRQNPQAPERPVVQLKLHKNGTEYKEEKILDLMNSLTLFIEDTVD